MRNLIAIMAVCASVAAQAQAPAPVTIQGGWARSAMQGQGSSGAYMTLVAREPLTLLGAESPAAGIIEIHQMKMDGDIMKMRAVETLDLRPGRPVEFSPGGYHFMLMDLKMQFRPGAQLPLTLRFRDAQGRQRVQQVSLPIAHAAPPK